LVVWAHVYSVESVYQCKLKNAKKQHAGVMQKGHQPEDEAQPPCPRRGRLSRPCLCLAWEQAPSAPYIQGVVSKQAQLAWIAASGSLFLPCVASSMKTCVRVWHPHSAHMHAVENGSKMRRSLELKIPKTSDDA